MEEQMHPVTVIGAYLKALDDALSILDQELAVPIDLTNSTAVSAAFGWRSEQYSCLGCYPHVERWCR
jgi:hypothetical protein